MFQNNVSQKIFSKLDSTATHYFYNIYKAQMQYIKPYIWHYK